MLKGVDARVRFDGARHAFVVRSGKYTLSFRHEAQAYYSCKRGIARRLQLLGETYFLPQIGFAAGDLIVDCGANVGELKYWFVENGIDVEYIGIEPSPLEHRCLAE